MLLSETIRTYSGSSYVARANTATSKLQTSSSNGNSFNGAGNNHREMFECSELDCAETLSDSTELDTKQNCVSTELNISHFDFRRTLTDFPLKLHYMVTYVDPKIVGWHSSNSFKIRNSKRFIDVVLPKYFPGEIFVSRKEMLLICGKQLSIFYRYGIRQL